jgi:hypothetical protein
MSKLERLRWCTLTPVAAPDRDQVEKPNESNYPFIAAVYEQDGVFTLIIDTMHMIRDYLVPMAPVRFDGWED